MIPFRFYELCFSYVRSLTPLELLAPTARFTANFLAHPHRLTHPIAQPVNDEQRIEEPRRKTDGAPPAHRMEATPGPVVRVRVEAGAIRLRSGWESRG